MRTMHTITALVGVLIICAMLQSCAAGTQLQTSPAGVAEVQGRFDLYLYGCHYPADIENVAILVRENQGKPFEIYSLSTSYKIVKGLPSGDALDQADKFVRCSFRDVWHTRLDRIQDGSGGTLGFELRPLYMPIEFTFPDVLITSYTLKDGNVRAYIRLDPTVERAISSDGDGGHSGHGPGMQ